MIQGYNQGKSRSKRKGKKLDMWNYSDWSWYGWSELQSNGAVCGQLSHWSANKAWQGKATSDRTIVPEHTLEGSSAILPCRTWRVVGGSCGEVSHEFGDGSKHVEGDTLPLTIMTFNTQAEAFEHKDLPWGAWEVRKKRLIDVVLQEMPDVVCLQEIDHFDDFFEPELRKCGYVGYFAPKTKKPKIEHLPTEGQAIFVLDFKFEVLSSYCWTSVNLQRTKNARLLKRWQDAMRPRVADKVVFGIDPLLQMLPQIALGLVLRPRACGFEREFLVVCLHLKSIVKNDILEQLSMSAQALKMHQLEALLKVPCETFGPSMPVLCCGDLNQTMSNEQVWSIVRRNGFIDAYSDTSSQGHPEPIDFILLGGGCGLTVAEVLELPPPDALYSATCRQLPNEIFPSDHLPLVAKVQIHKAESLWEKYQNACGGRASECTEPSRSDFHTDDRSPMSLLRLDQCGLDLPAFSKCFGFVV